MQIYDILNMLYENEVNTANVIHMVPSENSPTALAQLPLLLDVYNRYFFNTVMEERGWNFRGAQDVSKIEVEVAIPILKELSKAKYVNLRPISGLNCMSLVLKGLGGGSGSNVLVVSTEQGGHYATEDLGKAFGLKMSFIIGKNPHSIDFEDVRNQLKTKPIHLVYIDQSNCLFPLDVKELVKVVREVSPETIIHIDVSHWLGLILGGVMDNPLELGADSFGGSTHKTFPG